MSSVAVVSPGLLPVPPVVGGSVETVMQKMADVTKQQFNIDIYGPTHPGLPEREAKEMIIYYRFPAKNYPEYFKLARSQINNKNYSIIQVENRPLFIPKTKAANPKSKFICSLHSLDHIAEKLIKPQTTLKIFGLCDKVLVYSKFIRDSLITMFPKVADRFHFIHLGTETEKFRPRWEPSVQEQAGMLKKKLGIPAKNKVILFTGRVIPKKGVHVLLPAMERIIRAYPDCCLVIVGSGWFGSKRTSPYITGLHKQAAKLASKIRFTNYVPPNELPLYYALADVFVGPAQWDEPFGLVNVEAMASGVPVVASARGGIPEIVTDGVDGFLVKEEHNPRSFVKPVIKLLKNPDMAKAFGMSGRKAVEDYFNWSRAGRELCGLYKGLLG